MFKVKSYDENHPNPLFYRKDYTILDSLWDFKFDKSNIGALKGYKKGFVSDLKINVPYDYLSKKSGIYILSNIKHLWYSKEIDIKSLDKDVLIHFEGSDYKTTLYINSKKVGSNIGAYHSFCFNITDYLKLGKNTITVKIYDDKSPFKVRGKQRFTKKNWMCWYEETQGIFKSVWLEFVPKNRIEYFKIIPSFKNKNYEIEIECNNQIKDLKIITSYKNELVNETTLNSETNYASTIIDLSNNFHEWGSLNPELYDIELVYENDRVLTYTGIRDVYIKNKQIYLNDKPIYQKLILDQGYIEHGNLTMTKDELENDIKLMINMGFNGCRKHQKIESKIFYSLADFYGYIVWLEMPSFMVPCSISRKRMEKEWVKVLSEHYNYPSIISYTPFNESWGIFGINKKRKLQINFVNKIYNLTKTLDKTRLCQSNDGWCNAKTDFVTIHNYTQDALKFDSIIKTAIDTNYLASENGRYVSLYDYKDLPILVDEFGGTSFKSDKEGLFGYGSVGTKEEYINTLNGLFKALINNKRLCGYCYTQLSDVRQEINGLYTMDRKEKINPKLIKEIQQQK